jgi:hypothetical protein
VAAAARRHLLLEVPMAKVGFYVSEEEKAWIKRQGPGWFRMVVRKYIKAYPDKMPVKEKS